jgi:hypothetical protein
MRDACKNYRTWPGSTVKATTREHLEQKQGQEREEVVFGC